MHTHRHTLLFTMLTVALSSTVVSAKEKMLKEVGTTRVVVAALKDDRVAEEAATSLVQLTSETIERIGATDLQSALRYEPGVTFDMTSSGRMDDVKIRGVGGNRVMIAVDGAPVPKPFAFAGGYSDIGGTYFDIDAMKSVDIIKGPVSMLYGSSALAGGIFMQTKDPEDFIQEGRRTGFEIKTGYNTVDKGVLVTGTAAAKFTDELSAFIRTSYREHDERQNHYGNASGGVVGDDRTRPNPSDSKIQNLLSKVVYEPNTDNKFTLSYEYFNDKTNSRAMSAMSEPEIRTMNTVQDFNDHSTNRRQQFNIRHDFNYATPIFDKGHWMAYYQETKGRQKIDEVRFSKATAAMPPYVPVAKPAITSDRWRTASFDSKLFGFNAEFAKNIDVGSVSHELTYGATYKHNKVKTLRFGDTVDRATGQSIETQIFPNQSFPNSKVQDAGLFVQDRMGFLDNTIEVIMGLRYDHYSLKVEQGGGYMSANPGIAAPVNKSKGHLSKRLAVLYYPFENHTFYANYAEGFKAPDFTEINSGFGNLAHGYIARSNPNLKPETSQTFELGWNFNNDIHTASVAAFYTKYKDFIEEQKMVGTEMIGSRPTMIYQSVNLDRTYIYGLEAKTSLRVAELQGGDGELRFNGAIAYAKGKDDKTKEPIDSVDPLTAVLGVSYSYSDLAYVGLNWNLVAGKSGSDISKDLKDVGITKSAGYGTVDLIAEYKPQKNIRINAGIYNLFDKKYNTWDSYSRLSSAGGRGSMSGPSYGSIARSTQPGINAGISITVNF